MKKLITITALIFITQTAFAKVCNQKVQFKPGSIVKTPVYRCSDGTVSYSQPKTAYISYVSSTTSMVLRLLTGNTTMRTGRTESFCGTTAASNVHNAYCKKFFVNPRSIADKYFNDVNPGVRYDTMLNGLNKFFNNQGNDCVNGYWYMTHPRSSTDFLNALRRQLNSGKGYWKNPKTGKKISPAIVLINRTPKTASMHWVTVVGLEGYNPSVPSTKNKSSCIVHINEWGRRTKETCLKFIRNATQVNSPWITRWMHDYYLFIYR